MNNKVIIAVIILSLVIAIAGCSQAAVQGGSGINSGVKPDVPAQVAAPSEDNQEIPSTGTQSEQNNTPQVITVAQIMEKSKEYEGKDIIIQGKIVQECGSGCWFNLKDQTGVIYVDLLPSNLAIPQKVGSNARVYGTVTVEKGVTYVIGKKVEF